MNPTVILEAAGVALTALALIGAVVAWWLDRADKRQELDLDEVRKAHDKDVAALTTRLNALHDDQKALNKEFDGRLARIEREYVSRADHAEYRAELLKTMHDIGDGIKASLDGLGARFEKQADALSRRLEHLENA